MPKKFHGENTKAAAAKARKEEKKHADAAEKQKKLEDEYWKDEDKHVVKKQQRKDDRERKQQEQMEKKKEREMLLEEEMQNIKPSNKPAPPAKVTRAEIEKNKQKVAETQASESVKKNDKLVTDHENQLLEENLNRTVGEGDGARSVDDAIAVLSVKDSPVDRHPERRLKAAYAAYEERRMPSLKAENPGMRLQQLKQMLWKEWQKSPENPLNQRVTDFNFKTGQGDDED